MTLDEAKQRLAQALGDDLAIQDGGYIQASIDLSLRYPSLWDAITEILDDAEQEQTSANRRGSPAH